MSDDEPVRSGKSRVGTVIDGRYRVLEQISEGSMGVVYRGERIPIGRAVAIKFLHASFVADSEFTQRFDRETRVMSKLNHPNCVSVLDFGMTDAPYLVMDMLQGTTLRAVIDEGPIPVPRAMEIVRQLLAGLAHAHSQGIIHRDVKPANIIISDEIGHGDHVKILDFGLATLRGSLSSNLTQTHVVVGTPYYMSPEQTLGSSVDLRSDIYAAGVILYELISGERPFVAQDTLELFQLHRTAPIPSLARAAPNATLPFGLQRVINRALAKNPNERFASAVEFAQALEALAAPSGSVQATATLPLPSSSQPAVLIPSQKAATSWHAPKRLFIVFAALIGVALGVAVALGLFQGDAEEKVAAKKTAPPIAADVVGTPEPAVKPPAVIADAASLVMHDAGTAMVVPPGLLTGDAGALNSNTSNDAAIVDETAPAEVEAAEVDQLVSADDATTDEAPNAPTTPADADARETVVPQRKANTLSEAISLVKQGHREEAIASLRALWKRTPKSAYYPYLLGNLYFEKGWWTVGIEHYRAAIAANSSYRRKATLNRNAIRALGSSKTRGKAIYLIKNLIRSSAVKYLRVAAKSDPNRAIKKNAAALLRRLSRR